MWLASREIEVMELAPPTDGKGVLLFMLEEDIHAEIVTAITVYIINPLFPAPESTQLASPQNLRIWTEELDTQVALLYTEFVTVRDFQDGTFPGTPVLLQFSKAAWWSFENIVFTPSLLCVQPRSTGYRRQCYWRPYYPVYMALLIL
ncbi:hypothetical protein LshimejAT787_1601300 [Lyophyllum shimeji]|uniref:Uncharacterized protein n=1 Tax=Lyophyllum shimeji TaxID=47721 RepID=A0A9P3UU01_LYOSH|nr:hypothetical protein LshimejAT787_1601300 [Lyophyllum shimeji]